MVVVYYHTRYAMKKIILKRKKITAIICALALALSALSFVKTDSKAMSDEGVFTIVLDPGHGGSQPGTEEYYVVSGGAAKVVTKSYEGAKLLRECDVNLKTAQLIKKHIESMDTKKQFKIILTREDDSTLDLMGRAIIAQNNSADAMISVHYNNIEDKSKADAIRGMEVWQSVLPKFQITGLPEKILEKVNEQTGLPVSRGVNTRESGDNTHWADIYQWDLYDGSPLIADTMPLADYYGLIKAGAKLGVPTFISEHAFFSNDEDMSLIVKENDEGIDAIAKAEAEAIYEYYNGHTHDWSKTKEVDYPLSCISKGMICYHCSICKADKGAENLANTPDEHKHLFESWQTLKEPSDTDYGVEISTECRYCGKKAYNVLEKLATPTPTNVPTATPTNAPTATPTNVPTNKPTVIPTQKPITQVVYKTVEKKIKTPAKVKIKSIKRLSKKKYKIKLSKVTNKSYKVKYEIRLSTSKKYVDYLGKETKNTTFVLKLKNKSAKYIKVRAYINYGKAKIYGKWSSVKKI